MGSEIRRMFLGKGFWMGLAVAMAGIVFGAAYPKIEGLLYTGKFVNMEAEALKSQAMIFFFLWLLFFPGAILSFWNVRAAF